MLLKIHRSETFPFEGTVAVGTYVTSMEVLLTEVGTQLRQPSVTHVSIQRDEHKKAVRVKHIGALREAAREQLAGVDLRLLLTVSGPCWPQAVRQKAVVISISAADQGKAIAFLERHAFFEDIRARSLTTQRFGTFDLDDRDDRERLWGPFADVEAGMHAMSFQNSLLERGLTWTALRDSAERSSFPWVFIFSPFPSSVIHVSLDPCFGFNSDLRMLSFSGNSDLTVREVLPGGLCDLAGVAAGMLVCGLQGEVLAPKTTWKVLMDQWLKLKRHSITFSFEPAEVSMEDDGSAKGLIRTIMPHFKQPDRRKRTVRIRGRGATKCVVIGDCAVGKTVMFKQQVERYFWEDNIPTVFDNYSTEITVDGRPELLGLWDTAGQEDYDRMRPLSYPNADVFLICFSIISPASYENVMSKWYKELQNQQAIDITKIPIILVGTKLDLRDDQGMLAKLAEKNLTPLSFEKGEKLKRKIGASVFLECSGKTNHGVQAVFDAVVRASRGGQGLGGSRVDEIITLMEEAAGSGPLSQDEVDDVSPEPEPEPEQPLQKQDQRLPEWPRLTKQDQWDRVSELVSSATCAERTETGELLLHFACAITDIPLEIFERIVHESGNLVGDTGTSTSNRGNRMPLHYACENGLSIEAVDLLLMNHLGRDPGRNPTIVDDGATAACQTADSQRGSLPLHLACEGAASFDVCARLVTQYPEACAKTDRQQKLPLHYACTRRPTADSHRLIGLLLNSYPEACMLYDADDNLPLHLACANQQDIQVIEPLVAHNPAACLQADTAGQLPLHLAVLNNTPLVCIEFVFVTYPLAAVVSSLDPAFRGLFNTSFRLRLRESSNLACMVDSAKLGSWETDTVVSGVSAMCTVGLALKMRYLYWCGLNFLFVPTELLSMVASLRTLDLSNNNLKELPLELIQLTRLTVLNISDNPSIGDIEQIYKAKGVPGVFAYLQDLHDDPQSSFELKMLLAGPSMAGKTSILRALLGYDVALTAPDARTIGLEIERLVLLDESARAPNGVEFIVYDAGGHDEYQEMHQCFLTKDTTYVLVDDISRPRPGEDVSTQKENEQKLVGWATLIQSCAPGARVLLVGTHADAVGDATLVDQRCMHMADTVRKALGKHRQAQQEELKQLTLRSDTSTDIRVQHLLRVLESPLQLCGHVGLSGEIQAIAVSAMTLQGIDTLRHALVDAAFDQQSFPSFGLKQPRTYSAIYRHLLRSHADYSLTWDAMQTSVSELADSATALSVSLAPSTAVSRQEPTGLVGQLWRKAPDGFVEVRATVSSEGMLQIDDGRSNERLNLKLPGTAVDLPKKPVLNRPFCFVISSQSGRVVIVFDAADQTEHERWFESLQTHLTTESLQSVPQLTFSITLCDEVVHTFTTTLAIANAVHDHFIRESKRAVTLGFYNRSLSLGTLTFPAGRLFSRRKKRHSAYLLSYYQELFQMKVVLAHPEFKSKMGFDLEDLYERRNRVAHKVLREPDLIQRAMLFLRVTGQVLYFEHKQAALRQRVFLRPQLLVNLMREFVRHDLEAKLGQIDPGQPDWATVDHVGRMFLKHGVLDRRLLPWLWRDLRPQIDQEQIEFLLDLMTHLGLLTRIPGSDRMLLPMRLPEHHPGFAAADAEFNDFMFRMGGAASLAGLQSVPLLRLTDAVMSIPGLPGAPDQQALADACERAYAKADELLADGPDPNGLNREEIAAIHMYTQEGIQLYRCLNGILRTEPHDCASIQRYWGYMRLLQHALFKVPVCDAGTVFRGIKGPFPAVAMPDLEDAIDTGRPLVWWAFSSTSTSLPAVQTFLGTSGPRVIYSIDGGSRARDVLRYSEYPNEAELLMPCGTAFVVKTAAPLDADLIMVSLKQVDLVLFQGPTSQQHPALVDFATSLRDQSVDNAGRVYDFHQPIPAGLMALLINHCAGTCKEDRTSIWRRALVTLVDGTGGLCIEVSIAQEGLCRIAISARCRAGEHHDQCLLKMEVFEKELNAVITTEWKGCSASILCVSPKLPHGVALSECEHAAADGEDGIQGVLLRELLVGGPRVDASIQRKIDQLRFLGGLGTGLLSLEHNSATRTFCGNLDNTLHKHMSGALPGAFQAKEAAPWSTRLQCGIYTPQVLGEDLEDYERYSQSCGVSPSLALMATLGRLYERRRELVATQAFDSVASVCDFLLAPFSWLEPAVRELAYRYGVVDTPALRYLFDNIIIDEGVPKSERGTEPEPEPESHGVADDGHLRRVSTKELVERLVEKGHDVILSPQKEPDGGLKAPPDSTPGVGDSGNSEVLVSELRQKDAEIAAEKANVQALLALLAAAAGPDALQPAAAVLATIGAAAGTGLGTVPQSEPEPEPYESCDL